MRSPSLLVLPILWVSGCSLFASLDGYSEGIPSSVDAGIAMDGSRLDAAAKDASRPSLLANGDLELGCEDWTGSRSRRSTTAGRSGKGCTACAASGNAYSLQVPEPVAGPVEVGDRYRAEVWVRRTEGTSLILPALRSYALEPFSVVEVAEGDRAPQTSDWTLLTVEFEATKAAPFLDFYVYAHDADATDCFIADDVLIERVP